MVAALVAILVTLLKLAAVLLVEYTVVLLGPVTVSLKALPLTSVPVMVNVIPESLASLVIPIFLAHAPSAVAAVPETEGA